MGTYSSEMLNKIIVSGETRINWKEEKVKAIEARLSQSEWQAQVLELFHEGANEQERKAWSRLKTFVASVVSEGGQPVAWSGKGLSSCMVKAPEKVKTFSPPSLSEIYTLFPELRAVLTQEEILSRRNNFAADSAARAEKAKRASELRDEYRKVCQAIEGLQAAGFPVAKKINKKRVTIEADLEALAM